MKIFTRSICLLLVFLCAAGWQASAATVTISARNNFFSPATVTINPGDVVVFQWVEGTHTTAADNGAWGVLPLDASHPTQTLNLGPGTYPYHCTFHGAAGGIGMSGTITVRNSTGINDQKSTSFLSAYPNPSRGEVTFTLDQSARKDSKIKITNAIGETIKILDLAGKVVAATDPKLTIDLSGLPSGLYFYSLVSNDKIIETRRLVLQH